MTQNKRVIGITGGSGCGKSYISGLLKKRGLAVIDCDVVAREVMEPGKPCLLEVAEVFGERVIENGVLQRKALAEIVFSDEKMLKKLDEITHKYILEDIYNKIREESGDTVIIDGATLLESGILCDKMVGILADKEERKRRIMDRDGLLKKDAEMRINAQKPDSFYIERCDVVFYNNKEADVENILKGIME